MKKVKYAAYFLAMLLFASARLPDGLMPFNTGIFMGLVYAGENLALLAPLFLAATFIAAPSLETLILAAATIITTAGLYFIDFKLKRRVSLIEMNVAALIGRLSVVIMGIGNSEILIDGLISLFLSQLFVFACLIFFFAAIKRGIRNKLTRDELIAAAGIGAVFFLSFYRLSPWGFPLFYTVLAFLTVFTLYNADGRALIISLLAGLGAIFSGAPPAVAASLPLAALAALAFRRAPPIISAAAYLIAEIGAGFYLGLFRMEGLLHYLASGAGLIAFVCLPMKLHDKLKEEFNTVRRGLSARAVINMSRFELSRRISSVGKAFKDIENTLKRTAGENTVPDSAALRQELKRRVCMNCEKQAACYGGTQGDITELFDSLLKGAASRGKATLLDAPPLLTSICRNLNGLNTEATELVKELEKRIQTVKTGDKSKLLLAEQSAGIASLMNDLSAAAGNNVSAVELEEEQIREDLAYRNIICLESLMWNGGDRKEGGVTVIVRQEDADKKAILNVLSKRTGTKLQRSEYKCDFSEGLSAITFKPAPEFEVLSGECMATKTGSVISGDTRSIIDIGHNKTMLALSDGMGSGEEAERDSSSAIAMIENLYQAGFDSDTVLHLANNLLSSGSTDTFSALDIAIVDKESGYADFIKLGGVQSFIKTENGIEVIEGGALPLGIIENVKPVMKRRKLLTSELCILISDGVLDTLGAEEIRNILLNNSALNPQLLANEIVRQGIKRGIKDDITVIAFRIYRKV
jgi:stage II sporulation protein E